MLIPFATPAAAEKQIDQLQFLVNAAVIASTVIILTVFGSEKDITFLGLKTDTREAYSVAALALIVVNVMVCQLLGRLGDIVKLADAEEAKKVLASVFYHGWPLNPFSYFGAHQVARLHAMFGIGPLVFQWWLGLLALALLWNLMRVTPGWPEYVLWWIYIGLGALALVAIRHVELTVHDRVRELATEIESTESFEILRGIKRVFELKIVMSLVAGSLGALTFYGLTHISVLARLFGS